MKRILPAIILAILLLSSFSLPASGDTVVYQQASVTTQPATDITPYSAILHANVTWPASARLDTPGELKPASYGSDLYTVNGSIPNSTGYFRYGTSSAALTYSTPAQVLPLGTANFAADIVSLYPCSTYYYQAVFSTYLIPTDYNPSPTSYLVALATADGETLSTGLGVGINRLLPGRVLPLLYQNVIVTGAILSFRTTGCVTSTGSHNAAGAGTGSGQGTGPSNITVASATLSSARVAPGEKVDITAMVTNRGSVNGESKITLYVNGEQVESKGVTVASGQSTPIHFYVSQNEPGTYNVYVGGVSAGSFTVDSFAGNDILIYGIIALFTIGIAGTIFILARKRTA